MLFLAWGVTFSTDDVIIVPGGLRQQRLCEQQAVGMGSPRSAEFLSLKISAVHMIRFMDLQARVPAGPIRRAVRCI